MPISTDELNVRGNELSIKDLGETELRRLVEDNQMSGASIAKLYNCSNAGIIKKMKRYNIKSSYSIKKPALEPSEALSYILGTIYGDGCIEYYPDSKHYQITLTAKSQTFIDKFANAIGDIGLHCKTRISTTGYPRAVACSKIFCEWFQDLTLDDIDELHKGYEINFIQGFWDSEGTYGEYKTTGRNDKTYKYPHVSMSNTDYKLLIKVGEMIRQIGVKCKIYGPYKVNKTTYYNLAVVGGREHMNKFLSLMQRDVK